MCIFSLLSLAGCSEDAVLPDGQTNVSDKTLLTLNFSIEGEDTASRAVDDDDPEHPAATWENNIVTLQVFIKHADGTWEEPIYLWDITGSPYTVELDDLDLTQTTVYVGANLTMAQAQAFIQQETDDAAYTFTNNVFDLVTDLSPYSTENSDLTGRRHIAMFCTKGIKPKVTETSEDEEATPIEYTTGPFNLKRLVAKILVTCKTDGNGYVPVSNKNAENFEGWIRQSDVKYLVNGLNRKTFIMQQINSEVSEAQAYANVVDPNNELSVTNANNDDFYFQPIEGEYDSPYLRATLPFAEAELSSYTEGIYCPENTFALDETITFEGQQAQITHVCVAAKFTPRNLQVEYDLFNYVAEQQDIEPDIKEDIEELRPSNIDEVVTVECPSEAVARQLLLSSLQRANNRNGFPEGTYFYHNKVKAFYTYGAMGRDGVSMDDIDTNPGVFGDFVPYIGGWGYYYTYVDNREDYELTPNGWNEFYRHGQVERNRYYILNITRFTRPGSSVTNPNYIMVHTYSLPWEKGGSGEITLNPEDEIK
ncbi:hypothetical protein B5F71_12170 [Bacteroides sp. An269]|nr:hypothetical protein B5F71_12170 [Bacteroides sp. An269]